MFSWLLRGLGAFFIKRRMDPGKGKKDTLYRALLHTYMMECLGAGHNFEFFIEGGRTRTGKPCMPKGNIPKFNNKKSNYLKIYLSFVELIKIIGL